jgi:hypothetical protein
LNRRDALKLIAALPAVGLPLIETLSASPSPRLFCAYGVSQFTSEILHYQRTLNQARSLTLKSGFHITFRRSDPSEPPLRGIDL